ncbi:hypothetical protein NXS19_004400 [Fusarium pseudograminearum]|nr:hypothetical protein NXS19_004400 [Fusarium pseudograminearum]
MALFCTEYMLSRPLTPGLSKQEIHNYANKGYYGFHDYAAAFWWNHMQQVLDSSDLDNELARRTLQRSHDYLISTGELEQTENFKDPSVDIQFLKRKFQAIPHSLRDWDNIKFYEKRVSAVRESIVVLINQPYEQKEAALVLYGPWRYKCLKPWCQFFSRGFQGAQQQQTHINQHDLPFNCEYEGCFATEVGFEKDTDLKNHTRRWHPKEGSRLFPTVERRTRSDYVVLKAAAKTGNLHTIKTIVEQGNVSLDDRNRSGKSVFEVAAENGHLHVVQYLKEMGANLYIGDYGLVNTKSVFDDLIARRDLEMITFLCGLDNISMNRYSFGNRTLESCLGIIPFPQAMMSQLLRKARDSEKQAILHSAIQSKNTTTAYFAETFDVSIFHYALEDAVKVAHLPCLDALLSSGKIDPNTPFCMETCHFMWLVNPEQFKLLSDSTLSRLPLTSQTHQATHLCI